MIIMKGKLLKEYSIIELGGGSGQHGYPKYHPNFDVMPGPAVDVVCDLSKGIPLPDNSVGQIYSGDFYEHFTFEEGLALLKECQRVLKPSGFIGFLIPDIAGIVKNHPNYDESMQYLIYGTRKHEFDVHKMWYTPELMRYILEHEGGWEIFDIEYFGEVSKFLVRAKCKKSG